LPDSGQPARRGTVKPSGQAPGVVHAAWTGWDGGPRQHASLDFGPDGFQAQGHVAKGPEADRVEYALACDPLWRTRSVHVRLADGTELALEADGGGTWMQDGQPAPALDGALDVDLAVTPLTNTLPIRRLRLAVGEQATLQCVYVEVAPLSVRLDLQRYTRIAPNRYRFEAPGAGFVRDVEVDGNGIVTDYPGLFRRIA